MDGVASIDASADGETVRLPLSTLSARLRPCAASS